MSWTAHFSSLSFLLLLLYFSLLLCVPVTQATHVVFDDIGEMAGAVSYVHVVVPIELRHTAENAIALRQLLEHRFKQRVQAVHQIANKTPIETANDLSRLRVIITDLEETDHLFDRLLTLSQYFPHDFENLTLPPRFSGTFNFSSVTDRTDFQADFDRWFENRWNDPVGFYYQNRPPAVRKARFLPLVAGAAKLGASHFSTIDSLYARAQLKQIRKESTDANQEQRKITKLVSTNAVTIALLNTILKNSSPFLMPSTAELDLSNSRTYSNKPKLFTSTSFDPRTSTLPSGTSTPP